MIKVHDRQAFADLICDAFRNPKDEEDIIYKWAVAAEIHVKTRGFHYHMSLGLKYQRRWFDIDRQINNKLGIKLDWREYGSTYYDLFSYISKCDSHVLLSPGHGELLNPVQSQRASNAIRVRKCRGNNSGAGGASRPTQTNEQTKTKIPRLDTSVIHDIIVQNDLRTDKQLAAFAKTQAVDGKRDLQHWMLARPSPKSRTDFIKTVWLMEDSGI